MTTNGKPAAENEPDTTSFDEARREMVTWQIERRGVRDPLVLAAMYAVPRHRFVPGAAALFAYEDQPLPIGEGQTISQPFMVAAMTEAMELTGHERVLEVGTGSGYQAALLALLAREVFTIERHVSLANSAAERLARLGYHNVHVRTGDGTLGLPEEAPFDAIIVTAAAPGVPRPLVEQLADGGRLVIPVGPAGQQDLLRVRKCGEQTTTESLYLCRFVPLVGAHGWDS
jgi:protein-L-isoaspartate(D-aspartate) O-methyltransferase